VGFEWSLVNAGYECFIYLFLVYCLSLRGGIWTTTSALKQRKPSTTALVLLQTHGNPPPQRCAVRRARGLSVVCEQKEKRRKENKLSDHVATLPNDPQSKQAARLFSSSPPTTLRMRMLACWRVSRQAITIAVAKHGIGSSASGLRRTSSRCHSAYESTTRKRPTSSGPSIARIDITGDQAVFCRSTG
jgi:hypothetical protein